MENFYEIDHLVPKLDRDSVLKAMDCYEDSPVYEEVVDEYEEICEDMLKLAEPVGILGFGTLSESIETKQYKADPQSFKGHAGDLSTVLRIAVTGRRNTPDLCSIMRVLGYDTCISRIDAAINSL